MIFIAESYLYDIYIYTLECTVEIEFKIRVI